MPTLRDLLPNARGLPRAYWILFAGTFVNRIGGFVAPFLAVYLTDARHLDPPLVGLLVALYGGGILVAGLAGGRLADRIGWRRAMVFSLVVAAAAMLHLGLADGLGHIAVATFLAGLGGEMYRPALAAGIVDLVEPARRIDAFGLQYWVVNLAFSVAAVLAGTLSSHGYVWLFVGDAATTLLFAAVVVLLVPRTPGAAAPAGEREIGGLLDPFRNRGFAVLMVFYLAMLLVFAQHAVAFPVDLLAHGRRPSLYGSLIAINGLLIVVGQPLASNLVRRGRPTNALALAALLVGAGFALLACSGSLPLLVLSVVVWTLGELVMSPVVPTLVAAMSPPGQRGLYQGSVQMTWGAALLLAPALGPSVLDTFGARTLWLGCLGVGIAAALGFLLAGRRRSASDQ